jgi:hypothetical protein
MTYVIAAILLVGCGCLTYAGYLNKDRRYYERRYFFHLGIVVVMFGGLILGLYFGLDLRRR